MRNHRKRLTKSDFNFVNDNEFEPYVETNVLIREEAEYLANSFRNEILSDELVSNLSNISDNKSVIENSLNDIKDSISEVLPTKDVFQNFESSMQTTINKLDQIADLLKYNTVENQKRDISENKNKINKDEIISEISKINNINEREILSNFERILESKIDDANSKIQNVFTELEDTKKRFNELLVSYEKNLYSVTDKQTELSSYLFDSHDVIHNIANDLNGSKNNYDKLEKEISKIYDNWTQNNNLLNKLESLIYEIGSAKSGYGEDLNLFLEEIKEKTISNQKEINSLVISVNEMKDKIIELNNNYDALANIHDGNISFIKENVFNNQNEINELKEKDFKNIERFVEIELQLSKHKENIDILNIKVDELSNIERRIDEILSSEIFQKSLERKITNMIIENNNYLGDEFKTKIDNFFVNVISDIDESRKCNETLITNYQLLENKVLEINNNLNSIDKTAEIDAEIEKIRAKHNSLYDEMLTKFNDRADMTNSNIIENVVNENEIIEILNSSQELQTLIQDKTRKVIEDKLENINIDISSIQNNLEENIKDFNEKILANSLNEKIEIESSKIKNETLNILYKELSKRDEKIDLNSEELVNNYETILESNRILKSLEDLVIKQGEEFDGYRNDKTTSLSLLTDKISEQKKKISELEELIRINVTEFDFYSNSDSNKSLNRGLEAWRLEFSNDIILMVKNLVEEEIKKKNLLSIAKDKEEQKVSKPKNNSEDFFTSRIKDILGRLENSDLQKSFEEKFNLNLNIEDLKNDEKSNDNQDVNWFYEKEYNEFISKKKTSK